MRRYWKALANAGAASGRYLLLLAAVAIAFTGSLRGSFHFDDYSLFTNPIVTQVSGFWRVWNPVQTRPLTFLTFWLNYRFGGTNPIGYHAVNLLLHAAAVLLLYYVLKRLIPSPAAMAGAALFAVHPIQSEAVAYIFARGTLLCTLLCLVSLHEWLRGKRWAAVAWFAVALLAKEECVTFPAIILLILLSLRTLQPADRLPLQVMFAFAALAGLRAAIATRFVAGSGAGFTAGMGPLSYFGTQGWAILRYLRLLVVPWGFTVDPDIHIAQTWLYALAWLAVAALIALASRWFRELREGFWAIAGLVLLIPSSTIFPAADLAADRRMYLPMIAFTMIFGLFSRKWHPWIPASIVFVLASVSAVRMETWRTDRALWQEAVKRSPDKVRPFVQLSRFVPERDALDLLLEAKTIAPSDPAIASELGFLWLKMGQPEFALGEFGRALALKPRDPQAITNRGAGLMALHQYAAAQRDFEAALKIDPCIRAARIDLQKLGGTPPGCATEK